MWCKGCQRGQKARNGICPDCGIKLEEQEDITESSTVTVEAKDIELGGSRI